MSRIIGLGLFFLHVGLFHIAAAALAFAVIPWMVLVYLAGFLSNARPWPEMKSWTVWKWLRKHYFRFEVDADEGEEKATSSQPVIYAIYPHGHYALTHLFYFALNPRYAHARPAIHSFIFYLPFFATLARWIDAIGVTRKEMMHTLTQEKRSILMCAAGARDIVNTGTYVSSEHQGFLRVARDAGVKVVPVWCAEERNYYTHWLPLGDRLKRFFGGFPLPIFIWGKWWCPLLPRVSSERRGIIRIGKPMDPNEPDAFFEKLNQLVNKK